MYLVQKFSSFVGIAIFIHSLQSRFFSVPCSKNCQCFIYIQCDAKVETLKANM